MQKRHPWEKAPVGKIIFWYSTQTIAKEIDREINRLKIEALRVLKIDIDVCNVFVNAIVLSKLEYNTVVGLKVC